MRQAFNGRNASFSIILIVLTAGCSGPGPRLFTKSSAHETYARKLRDAGLDSSAMVNRWTLAASNALLQPVRTNLPHQENCYFAAERPDAAGWIFSTKRGQNIHLSVSRQPGTTLQIFADLFSVSGTANKLLASASPDSPGLHYEADADGDYLIRIQPELLQSGSCTVTITHGPSLAFPVAGSSARIGSFWGNDRDRGARKHEGIDIFDKFRTPVVAAADGFVTSVSTNNLGGKVVFMRPSGKNYNLYYAHLDSQIATAGQRVRIGDTLGLMGNTGNARNTPTHLHFGIYAAGGALNPLPFVSPEGKKPPAISASTKYLNQFMVTAKTTILQNAPGGATVEKVTAGVPVLVLSATGNYFKVLSANYYTGFVRHSDLKATDNAPMQKSGQPMVLLESPTGGATAKQLIRPSEEYKVIGHVDNYRLLMAGDVWGWAKY